MEQLVDFRSDTFQDGQVIGFDRLGLEQFSASLVGNATASISATAGAPVLLRLAWTFFMWVDFKIRFMCLCGASQCPPDDQHNNYEND